MKFLSETTLVPLGTALLVFGSGAVWCTKIQMVQEAQAAEFKVLQQRQDVQLEFYRDIRERLIRIEVLMEKRKSRGG